MTIINKDLIDSLLKKAKESPRLRMNYDLRNSEDDTSQRMLNALMPNTIVPIHRHPKTSETVVILCGEIDEIMFDNDGNESKRIHMDVQNGCYGINIPMGQWHTIKVYKPTVILEVKDGKFYPTDTKDIL